MTSSLGSDVHLWLAEECAVRVRAMLFSSLGPPHDDPLDERRAARIEKWASAAAHHGRAVVFCRVCDGTGSVDRLDLNRFGLPCPACDASGLSASSLRTALAWVPVTEYGTDFEVLSSSELQEFVTRQAVEDAGDE